MTTELIMKTKFEYIQAVKSLQKYYRDRLIPPTKLQNAYNDALDNYRYALDCAGYYMPLPLYPYSLKDKHTWKYKDVTIDGKKFVRDIVNPDFKYSHVSPIAK
jgi:hypothetical protein